LIKLLGMTGSMFDGEAVAAIRKANALLRDKGLTWADVITATTVESATQSGIWREPESWRDAVGICLSLDDAPLSDWDRSFLVGILRWHSLSEKQEMQLNRIIETCRFHSRKAA
jgi:hypothetical protein